MSKVQKITSSAYRKIALGIATDVVNGKYVEGQKLFGRSILASHYKVSPETIRKAVYLLKDVGVLDTEKGSGIEVKSVAKARMFLEHYNELENIAVMNTEVRQWAQKQIKETAEIIKKVQFIVDATERLKNVNYLTPYEIRITGNAAVIGKTIKEICFWHNTGGTVIAIKRSEDMIISPGSYATFCEGDVFYIVGDGQAYSAAMKLIYG